MTGGRRDGQTINPDSAMTVTTLQVFGGLFIISSSELAEYAEPSSMLSSDEKQLSCPSTIGSSFILELNSLGSTKPF